MESIHETTYSSVDGPGNVVTRREVVPIRTEHPQRVYETKKTIFRTYQIIWYILGVIEVILAFRFVFKLMGANPLSGFVSLIYAASTIFVAPFIGILPSYVAGSSVFEWSTIIAAVVYFFIAWGIIYLFQLIKPVTPPEVEEKVDNP